MFNDYASLSNRRGYNKSLSHFRLVTSILTPITKGENLADLVDQMEKDKKIEKAQIGPILNALVVERMRYSTASFNLPTDSSDFDTIQSESAKWNLFDIIIAYHHPQLGITLINPKKPTQWEAVQDLTRQELMVMYIKAVRESDTKLEADGLRSLKSLLVGDSAGDTSRFNDPALKAKAAPKAPAPKAPAPAAPKAPAAPAPSPTAASTTPPPAPPAFAPPAASPPSAAPATKPTAKSGDSGKKRMTPKYSVQVTNELFHNGNVEAWKNIVESYTAKFPELDVHIFHDGEKVNDINALFKWGKVKNQDVLLFSVSGEEIKGVSKLQRYLFEGASQRFGTFLKKDVNKVLTLF